MNLIFSQVYNGEDVLISSAFNMALPVSCIGWWSGMIWLTLGKKIYAISMMWTLNARRHIRVAGSSGYLTSSTDRGQTLGRSRLVSCPMYLKGTGRELPTTVLFADPSTRRRRAGSPRDHSGPHRSRDSSAYRCTCFMHIFASV